MKGVPKFWPTALLNHHTVSIHAVHHQDQVALDYLEDVWLSRDPKEKRCFILEFVRCLLFLSQSRSRTLHIVLQYFRENPFFHDSVLKKEYRYIHLTDVDGEKKDEWGITDAQAAFSWDANVEPQVLERIPDSLPQVIHILSFCRPSKSTGRMTPTT